MIDDQPTSRFDSVAVLLGVLAMILAIATVVQAASNRSLQGKVAAGQAKLAQAQAMANLNNSLIQLMAKTAAEKDDRAIRDLLARNGVTFNSPPAPVADAAGPEAGK